MTRLMRHADELLYAGCGRRCVVTVILRLHGKEDQKMESKRGVERNVVENTKMQERKVLTNNL
jgi:hypothetical protein